MQTPPAHVLQVLACDDMGGTELMVANLVGHMDRRTVRSEVVTLAPSGPIAERLTALGVPVRSLAGGGVLGSAWRLGALLRKRRFDVVNAYGFTASVLARVLVRVLAPRTRFVCGVRGLHITEVESLTSAKARVAAAVERALSPLVDVYDTNSLGAAAFLRGLGVDDRRIVYIPNGLDINRWSVRGEPDPEATPHIVCVSRFVARKRVDDLVQALAELAGDAVEFRATIAGDGPTLVSVEALAARLGVADRISFPGRVSNEKVETLLEDAYVFCLPSAWEGMPGAVMEAMARGVPVVGTDVNGTRDLIEPGVTGVVVPPAAPNELAAALSGILSDPRKAGEMGRAGRRRLEHQFSLAAMVTSKQDLYRSLTRSR